MRLPDLTDVETLLRAAALPAVTPTPAGVVQAIVRAAHDKMVGHRVTVRSGDAEIAMNVLAIDTRLDPLRVARGDLDDIRLVAEDVRWGALVARRFVVAGRNVTLRPSLTLIAAPLEVEVTVGSEFARDQMRLIRPGVLLDVDECGAEPGAMRLRWSRLPRCGHLEVTPQAAGSVIQLRPRALVIAGRRFRVVRALPPIRIGVPELPRELRLTAVEVGESEIRLRAVTREWREQLSITKLVDLLRQLTTAAANLSIP